MLHVGLDLSRKRLDYLALTEAGDRAEEGAAPPDADGLRGLAARLARHGEAIQAAIESMNGARFVHDQLELSGWEVELADAQKDAVPDARCGDGVAAAAAAGVLMTATGTVGGLCFAGWAGADQLWSVISRARLRRARARALRSRWDARSGFGLEERVHVR